MATLTITTLTPSGSRIISPIIHSNVIALLTHDFFFEITTDGISINGETDYKRLHTKNDMIPNFCKNVLTPYFQSTIKPIVLIVTTQRQVPDPEAAHLQTPSDHRRHYRRNGL
jgi:hypothetical protein